MGEIVDLESYRRRQRRKSARSQGAGNRRNPERAATRGEASGRKGNPRFGDSGKSGSAGNAKIDKIKSRDPKSE